MRKSSPSENYSAPCKQAPEPLAQPDWKNTIEYIMEYMRLLQAGQLDAASDIEDRIKEEAVVAVYGETVYDWINLQLDPEEESDDGYEM